MKHRSDLKHASVARSQAEDKEKEARNDARSMKTRVTCGLRWRPWSGPAKRLLR